MANIPRLRVVNISKPEVVDEAECEFVPPSLPGFSLQLSLCSWLGLGYLLAHTSELAMLVTYGSTQTKSCSLILPTRKK